MSFPGQRNTTYLLSNCSDRWCLSFVFQTAFEFLDVTSAAVVFKVTSATIPKMSGGQLPILCIGNEKLMRSLILSLCENLQFFSMQGTSCTFVS
jgi:hypothetical protein